MGSKTGIAWTDSTWTPIRARRKDTGKIGWHCEKVSQGCVNCYSEHFNERGLPSGGTGLPFTVPSRDQVEVFLDEKILAWPLRWKKPRRVFVCSMTDLFAGFVSDEFIDQVFAVMALADRHSFQILTKRPERMLRYMNGTPDDPRITTALRSGSFADYKAIADELEAGGRPCDTVHSRVALEAEKIASSLGEDVDHAYWDVFLETWPLPNVWVGVSVENQATADERIPLLMQTPAAVRFVSYEPALGPVDFQGFPMADGDHLNDQLHWYDYDRDEDAGIDWVIAGGESGPKARPFDLAWARSAVKQCKTAGVPVFVKQLGSCPVMDVQEWKCTTPLPRLQPRNREAAEALGGVVPLKLINNHGDDISEFPPDLRLREWPR